MEITQGETQLKLLDRSRLHGVVGDALSKYYNETSEGRDRVRENLYILIQKLRDAATAYRDTDDQIRRASE